MLGRLLRAVLGIRRCVVVRSISVALCALICSGFISVVAFVTVFLLVSLVWGYDASWEYVIIPTIVVFGVSYFVVRRLIDTQVR